MPWSCMRMLTSLVVLLIFNTAALAVAQANRPDLPRRFSVEVSPALQMENVQQDAVVYRFDGERVTGAWTSVTQGAAQPGKGKTRIEMRYQLTGTFRNGVLKAEQRSVMHAIPPAGYSKHHPGGPVVIGEYLGVIEGRLQSDGRIKAQLSTTLVRYRTLLEETGSGGAPTHRWVEQPVPKQTPKASEFWIALPAAGWFNTRYIQASGAEHFQLRGALERLDRYMNEASQNLLDGQFALARKQIGTIRAEVGDLGKMIRKERLDTTIVFQGLPTDDAMLQRYEMQFMMDKWKELYIICNDALAEVQTQLADLRNILSVNVFKSILKNYINWSNSIPTDVVSGLAGYSTITGIADLPRGFLGWYEEGQKDAGILRDQFRTKRALETLEGFYEQQRREIIDERRKVAERLKALDKSPLMGMDRDLQKFFAKLRWADWQADPKRGEAPARLE